MWIVGAFFLTKRITSNNGTVCKMQLWDTAGQERFRTMVEFYSCSFVTL